MDVIHISMGGPDRKIRDHDGKEFMFEDHPRFGPILLNKRGDPVRNQPGEKSSFWSVYGWWCEQDKKIDADGFCIWSEPAPTHKIEYIVGRHFKLVKI